METKYIRNKNCETCNNQDQKFIEQIRNKLKWKMENGEIENGGVWNGNENVINSQEKRKK